MNSKVSRKMSTMICLSQKAGKLKTGEQTCEASVKDGTSRLIILSYETSKNTTKKFTNKTKFYNVPLVTLNITKAELGGLIGKDERAVLSVVDSNFAKQIISEIEEI